NDTSALPSVEYVYNLDEMRPVSLLTRLRVISGQPQTLDSYSFMDGIGRERQTKSPISTGKRIVSGQMIYNGRGLAIKTYLSYTATASSSYVYPNTSKPFSSTVYDGLGRVTKVTAADGATASSSYLDWTTTETDANGHTKDTLRDA